MISTTVIVVVSCQDNSCVTCIAQDVEMEIVDYRSACDKDDEFRNGFVSGFKSKNEAEGNKVSCNFYTDER
jgi:hypothetical protein